MRIFSLSMLMLALCAACGSSPEPKPEPAAEGPRPGSHGCSACEVRACYAAETPNRLQWVEVKLNPTVDGKAVNRAWQNATLELKPATGTSQGVEMPTGTWKAAGPIKSSVKEPDMKPAPGGWKDVSAALTVKWKEDGKIKMHKFTTEADKLMVTVEACK